MAVDPRALLKAQSRMRVAEKSVTELRAAKSHIEFSDTWYTFLVAAKNIYTALEQGAKSNPHDKQWFGAKKAERKNDPLLQYLFQARDDDEHGIDAVVELEPGGVDIGVMKPGFSTGFRMDTIGGKMVITSLDDKPVLVRNNPAHTRLAPVTGRGPVRYNPPEMHLGRALSDNLPITVAELALDYFRSLLAEAESRA